MLLSVSPASQHTPPGGVLAAGAVLLVVGGAGVAAKPDDTGPILAFIGALIVAILASWTARRNMRDQIDGEADRHQKTLDSDRSLVDIQHLRELLDSSAAAYEDAYAATVRYAVALQHPPNTTEDRDRRGQAFSEAYAAERKLSTELHRIEMRFEDGHPVCNAYREVDEQVKKRVQFLSDLEDTDGVLTGKANEEDTGLGGQLLNLFSQFTASVRTEIGIRQRGANRARSNN